LLCSTTEEAGSAEESIEFGSVRAFLLAFGDCDIGVGKGCQVDQLVDGGRIAGGVAGAVGFAVLQVDRCLDPVPGGCWPGPWET
jgi:hypothetical protein